MQVTTAQLTTLRHFMMGLGVPHSLRLSHGSQAKRQRIFAVPILVEVRFLGPAVPRAP